MGLPEASRAAPLALMMKLRSIALALAIVAARAAVAQPSAGADALLAADRAFAAQASSTDLVTALTRMFADDVAMLAPGAFARGVEEADARLRTNPDNPKSKVEWTPIRAGVSGDGTQGFTYGYIATVRPDGSRLPGKYVAYWRLTSAGWRVAVYKRAPRPPGTPSLDLRPLAVPTTSARGGAAAVARYVAELQENERAFSRDAQRGFGAAFTSYAAPDGAHLGGPTDVEFRFGPEAIGQGVGGGAPPDTTSTTTWEAREAIAASSGDLGITLGTITTVVKATATAEARRIEVPFFTIWRRAGPGAPWRFVIE